MDKMHASELSHNLCARYMLYILSRHFRMGKVLVFVLVWLGHFNSLKLQMHRSLEKKRRIWCKGHSLSRAYRFVILSPEARY